MIDTHLINMALAIFGICAGTAVLISAAIIAVAAVMQHKIGTHGTLSVRHAGSGRAVRHEPALR
ncbi:MAG TPA: hypothetical protein VLX31_16890 [Streptosporangiaceae bacterium]|nr:hypothetical protein [Streptosporangiaceae bacterium]